MRVRRKAAIHYAPTELPSPGEVPHDVAKALRDIYDGQRAALLGASVSRRPDPDTKQRCDSCRARRLYFQVEDGWILCAKCFHVRRKHFAQHPLMQLRRAREQAGKNLHNRMARQGFPFRPKYSWPLRSTRRKEPE